ncbi:MAG: acyltransferase [Clostridium sp.]|nr:acyltransferase [Clostridium sp.]
MIHVGYSFDLIFLRMAVPIFFVLSSHFFFSKVKETKSRRDIWERYRHFTLRSLKLYLFWFILLLPTTYEIRHWGSLSPGLLIITIIREVLLSSTFPASWYISALIIGVSLQILLYRNERIFISIAIIGFLLSCLNSNYMGLIEEYDWGKLLFHNKYYNFYTSFPAGLIYIYIGRRISESKKTPTAGLATIGLVSSLGLLYLENYIISELGCQRADDCYLSLIVLAPSAVIWTNRMPQIFKISKIPVILRKFSTVYYCSHIPILRQLYIYLPGEEKWKYLILTILGSTFLGIVFLKLARIGALRIFKYSY